MTQHSPSITPVRLTCLALVIAIMLMGFLTGQTGAIGIDNDDMMRLLQVRDLYHGQNWFDTTQYRMGPEGGILMHWSRIIDAPIVLLMAVFDLVFPYEMAEKLAFSIWPPMTAVLALYGIFYGAKNLGGEKAGLWALFLGAVTLGIHFRFSPGAIDHHNVQIGLIGLGAGLLISDPKTTKPFIAAGIAIAFSMAIGTDVYPLLAMLCAGAALFWLIYGARYRRAITAFSAALAISIAGLFFALTPPSKYAVIYCDSFSLFAVIGVGLGGAGLALLAHFCSNRSLVQRLIFLIILGAFCFLAFSAMAPQCLANPLDSLPDDVRNLWLSEVDEAESLFVSAKDFLIFGLPAIGSAVLALIIGLSKSKTSGGKFLFMSFLLAFAVSLSVYQYRYSVFAMFLAVPILAVWLSDLIARKNKSGTRSLWYIPALALCFPPLWGIPGLVLAASDADQINEARNTGENCYSSEVMEYLAEQPAGRIAVSTNGAPYILLQTHHKVLSGNYHRNAAGILANIRIFTSGAEQSLRLLKDYKVDRVYFCKAESETALRRENQVGLMARLYDGEVPNFLQAEKTFTDAGVTIYSVR